MNRNISFAFVVLLLLLPISMLTGQNYAVNGRISDNSNLPVPFVSVLLLNEKDSSYIQGTVSDTSGVFSLKKVSQGNYLLLTRHVMYKQQYTHIKVQGGNLNLTTLILATTDTELKEVSVKASRPVMSMKNNILSYNASTASKKFIHNNALEVLGDVPGVLLKDEVVQLVGASHLDIAINGKPSTLTMDQVIGMLKSMPNTRIKEVQVMYAPPARYNVKGSLINIILTQAGEDELNGSVTAGYIQKKKPGANAGLNLQYGTSHIDFDFLYSGNYTERNRVYDIDILHTFRDTLYTIDQRLRGPNKKSDHNLQLNTTLKLRESENLSLAYAGNYTDEKSTQFSDATFSSVKGLSNEQDENRGTEAERMHNLRMDYTRADKLNAGVDYTNYQGPSTTNYQSIADGQAMVYRTTSDQDVNKWMGYFNQTISLKKQASVNYGANYAYSSNKNRYNYYYLSDGVYLSDENQTTLNNYNESTLSMFAGYSGNLGDHLSLNFSLKGEFDRMKKDSASVTKTLWNESILYPSMNISYTVDSLSNHIFQLSLKSYTNYPSYWEISPAIWYTNRYMLIKGNPELRPSRTYAGEFNYIFRKKYVAVISYEYTSKMISQIPYASEETFNTIARNENLDYGADLSAALVLPFNIGDFISINPTIAMLHRRMKREATEGQNFDRSSTNAIFQMDNSATLSKKHGLKLTVSGYYYTPMIQTIYDVKRLYDVSCGLAWNFLDKKALLTIKVNDIFRSNEPVTKINTSNQHSTYHFDWDSRQFLVSFKYNFGKPLKDKKIEVDKSRFRRLE